MKVVQWVLIVLIFVVALAFAVINADDVPLNYYLGTSQVPLSLVLVFTFALGAALGVLAALGKMLFLKREISRLRRAARSREQELANLRALPIRDDPGSLAK